MVRPKQLDNVLWFFLLSMIFFLRIIVKEENQIDIRKRLHGEQQADDHDIFAKKRNRLEDGWIMERCSGRFAEEQKNRKRRKHEWILVVCKTFKAFYCEALLPSFYHTSYSITFFLGEVTFIYLICLPRSGPLTKTLVTTLKVLKITGFASQHWKINQNLQIPNGFRFA